MLGGNTNTPRTLARHWCFTLKAEDKSPDEIITKLRSKTIKYAFQLEQGGKSNYEHYQGYMYLRCKERLTAIKKWLYNDIHLEVARDPESSWDYCQKEDSRINGPWIHGSMDPVVIRQLWTWQKRLEEELMQPPDDRTIRWYWEKKGNAGKSAFGRYLCVKYGALIVGGKKADILYALAQDKEASIVIVDISRSMEDSISYDSLEQIKNACFFAGKYESKMIIRDYMHVVVFANYAPDTKAMSADRWIIKEIGPEECYPDLGS